jgi:hypothetical protein
MLGQPDHAMIWLQVAGGDGFPCYPCFASDPTLDPLRRDPAFKSFLGELRTQWEDYKHLK